MSIDNATAILFVWVKPKTNIGENDGLYVARLTSHRNMTTMEDVSVNAKAIMVVTQYSLYDLMEFSLEIPATELNNMNINYVYFACNPYVYPTINSTRSTGSGSGMAPGSLWNVPIVPHTSLSIGELGSFNDSDAKQVCQLVSNMFPKLSDLYFGVFITEAVVWLSCIPLYFFFFRHQPLKSRSIIPLASVLFNYSITMTSLPGFITTLEWAVDYECIIYGLLIQPAFLIMSTLLFLNYFRYLLIVNLNRNKEAMHDGKVSMHLRSIKILKTLSSETSMVLIVIGLFLACVVFTLVVYGAFQGLCTRVAYLILSTPLYLSLLPFLGICGLFVYDWVSNCPKILKCKFKAILFESDPYYYRFEQWIGIFCVFLFCPIVVFIVLMSIMNGLRIELQQDVYLALAILTSICIYAFFIYLYGFVMSVTIIKWLWRQLRPPKHLDNNNQLEIILKNEDLLSHFTKYAKQEWSLENLDAYIEISKFSKNSTLDFAKEIFNKYLNGSESPCELNLGTNLRLDVKNAIQSGNINPNLFEGILIGIRTNLSDTYSRFINTKQYITWKTNYDIQLQAMK